MQRSLPGIRTGRVEDFNASCGWGFIQDMHLGISVFVHYSSLYKHTPGFRTLWKGEYVNFIVLEDRSGRPAAQVVTGILGGPLMCDILTIPDLHPHRTPME